MWQSICHQAIDWIDVSVDAATPATYALKRGGDFALLMENLQLIRDLRRAEDISLFQIHFVVQSNNYTEMKRFVELGNDLGCDRICFKQLVNWGTFSDQELHKRAIQRPQHPEHPHFLQGLHDPIFHHPTVCMHDLTGLYTSVTPSSAVL